MTFCVRCATPLPDAGRYCTRCGYDNSGDTARSASMQPLTPDPDLEQRVRAELGDQYVPEKELGRGGMGAVFLATEQRLGRRVAIKVLPPSIAATAVAVERFLREARTAATLDHPHIIPIYRVSDGGNLHWFSMKYVDGESLADILDRDGSLPLERTVSIVEQVADALHFANTKGVIHRDVKPGNVMLSANDWVTVTDFGIAKAAGTQSLTGSGSMMGTPYYMSPEQCAGSELTPAADQYSLAVMAFQALSGRLPFVGDTAVDIIKRHCFDPPPSILTLRPDLPAALAEVIDRALAKPAADRFPSVEAFAAAFARAARGEAVPEARVRVTRPAPTARARMPYVAGGLAGIAVVVVAVWRPWSRPAAAPAVTPPSSPAPRESVATPAAPPPAAQRKPAPAPALAVAPVASGYLTVGSTPQARLSVNGTVVPTNPVYRYKVPAGTVQLRFTLTDSAGTWSYDTTVAVAPNETRNIGRVRLVRP